MFSKILIANRGEIAVRVLRACRELGIRVVLAHSEADRDSQAARLADETVCIGPGPACDSYLNIANILSAAKLTEADAIHPGYGFLSENSYLSEACAEFGIAFIGPSPQAMADFSHKVRARELMQAAGVPVLPGSGAQLRTLSEALAAASEIGYPLMLKAVAGGGGRGMRVIHGADQLTRSFALAEAEAQQAFGDGSLYLERLIERGRHIEVQVAADRYGHAIHLGERECSLQRRHQKIVEESPSPNLPLGKREEIGLLAASALAACGYTTIGTVEFIGDARGELYFLEVNSRLQVEHGVTEMVTGIDLVKLQIALAAGEELPYRQEDIHRVGHAIECRVTAEDTSRGFAPSAGRLDSVQFAAGPWVRTDSHVFAGCSVPPFYDSLLAKIITWGRDRTEAVGRMQRALGETSLDGIPTNLAYLRALVGDARFVKAEVDVEFVERHLAEIHAQNVSAGVA
jgi:acetyl-CoA carboxylase, biotin carboxylase subunit